MELPRRDEAQPSQGILNRGPQPPTASLWVNVVLGAWLFVSAFLWPHTKQSLVNSCVVGALLALYALLGLRARSACTVCALLAVWLIAATLVIAHRTELTFQHNLILGAVALAATLIPRAG